MLDPGAALLDLHRGLALAAHGVHFAPVRHHSPACAWAVRAMLRELRPRHVLIEAPTDFTPHAALLAHVETRPPVAITALVSDGDDLRVAAYYPFCAHSPEFVAVREAFAIGADVRFIDLPSADKVMLREHRDDAPVPLSDDVWLDSSDLVRALCRRTGASDGFELWDHLFESRLGDPDWRALLADVGAYCAGIRAATSPHSIKASGDAAREAFMAAAIQDAMRTGGPVAVITGGFHTPALMDAIGAAPTAKREPAAATARSFLIRYSFQALDALNGYAAGLPQPAYYDFLWRRAEAGAGERIWRDTALDLVTDFARRAGADGFPVSVPQQVEMARAAEALARLRGRPGALRNDIIDAARTALVKGEAGPSEAWTERLITFLRGDAIGDIPASAGSPPLVEHARALARAHRFDISDGARRRRRLDIRRKPAHLAASRYLHAMSLLGTHFAVRDAGPDYVANAQSDLLFEEWSYAWSPAVEARLIGLSALGDRIDTVGPAVLRRRRDELRDAGQGGDIAAICDLIAQGVLAGFAASLQPLVADLCTDLQQHGDFAGVAHALRRLAYMASTGGPLRAPPELGLADAAQAAYLRIVYLCDDLPVTPPDGITARIEALRITAELLNDDAAGALDRDLFDGAIDRVARAHPPPQILGAVLALCVQAGRRSPETLCAALSGAFAGATLHQQDRIGVLVGMMQAAPEALWRIAGLLEAVDAFLTGIDEDAFLDLLPHLRLAFSALNPREIDQVAERLAQLHGASPSIFAAVHHALSPTDLQRGLALDRALRESADADGLTDWLRGEAAP